MPATCGAKTRTGHPCKNPPIQGAKRCRMHGSATTKARKAAKTNTTAANIQTALTRAHLTGKATTAASNPLDELHALTTETRWHLDQLMARINSDHTQLPEIEAYLDLYDKAVKNMTKLLDIALKHDIDAKHLALQQHQANNIAAAIKRIINGANLTPQQKTTAQHIAHTELTKLAQQNP